MSNRYCGVDPAAFWPGVISFGCLFGLVLMVVIWSSIC
jgi:hypothetical protein